MIAGFVRGLSVRDVEATLADALGAEAALSKSTVSRVCEAIKVEFDTWRARDLSDVEPRVPVPGRLATSACTKDPAAEPVLAAWGITTEGRPVLVGLGPVRASPPTPGPAFLDDMVGRGLRPPLLVVSDGAPGLIAAVELVFPHSLRQRCAIHRARNVLAKVPAEHQAEVKAAYWVLFDDTGEPPGERRSRWPDPVSQTFSATSGRRSLPRSACARRPGQPVHLPALPRRAPQAPPALQLHRAHLRRDPSKSEGHRTAPRRTLLPVAGVGRARPGQPGLARGQDPRRRPALQDLRRQLLDPPSIAPTVTSTRATRPSQPPRNIINKEPASVRFTPSAGRHHTIGTMTKGMDEIAGLIRKALAAEDMSAFAELLDPAVTWRNAWRSQSKLQDPHPGAGLVSAWSRCWRPGERVRRGGAR